MGKGNPNGRGTKGNRGGSPSKYNAAYCQKLIDYMGKGFTLTAFAAAEQLSPQTVITWRKKHPEFALAHKAGLANLERRYLEIGQAMALGQLHRVASEQTRMRDGRIVYDTNGDPVRDKVYEPTNGNAAAFIWLTKNVLGWRDKKDIRHGGEGGGPIAVRHEQMTPEERLERIEKLRRNREDCGND